MNFHWKDCCWSWSSNTLATWCKKNWLIWKDHDARKGWRQEEKGTAEDEMVGWHHWLALEFEQALGVGDRQGSLACNIPGGCKDSDTTEGLNWIVPHLFLCPHGPHFQVQILVRIHGKLDYFLPYSSTSLQPPSTTGCKIPVLLWVESPPKAACWSPYPQCDFIW